MNARSYMNTGPLVLWSIYQKQKKKEIISDYILAGIMLKASNKETATHLIDPLLLCWRVNTRWCQYSNYNLIFWYAKLMNFCFNFFFCVHIFSLLLSGWLNTHYAEKIFIGPLIRTKLKLYASLALAGLQELFEFSALQCICFIEHKYTGWLFLDKWTT